MSSRPVPNQVQFARVASGRDPRCLTVDELTALMPGATAAGILSMVDGCCCEQGCGAVANCFRAEMVRCLTSMRGEIRLSRAIVHQVVGEMKKRKHSRKPVFDGTPN